MCGRPGGRRILMAVACLWLPGMSLSAAERPNILLIVADDLGYSDLGCYGGEIATPNLDRLARQGLRFTQFYNNAICTGTRASLVTGLYPRQVGLTRLQRCVTSAEVLRAAGYRTLMAGKWHLAGDPRQRGAGGLRRAHPARAHSRALRGERWLCPCPRGSGTRRHRQRRGRRALPRRLKSRLKLLRPPICK